MHIIIIIIKDDRVGEESMEFENAGLVFCEPSLVFKITKMRQISFFMLGKGRYLYICVSKLLSVQNNRLSTMSAFKSNL